MRKMTENGAELRRMIQQKSATPAGFAVSDAEEAGLKNIHKVVHKMTQDGVLFQARVNIPHLLIRYFLTATAMQSFKAKHQKDADAAKAGRKISIMLKPNKATQIVYPENYLFTCCPPMPTQYRAAEALPWQHGGMRAMS